MNSRRTRLAISFFMFAVTGCIDLTSPDDDLRGLAVRIFPDRTTVRPGDSVFIRAFLTNNSDEPITFTDDPRAGCPLALGVRAPRGINYYAGPVGVCSDSSRVGSPLKLLPGDSLLRSGWWPGITYVSAASDVRGVTGPAPPGVYYVVGIVQWDLRHSTTSPDSVRIVVQ